MKNIKVFDFFSGCGGASEGLQQAGMEIVLGLDMDADSAKSYQANFPEAFFIEKSITDVNVEDIKGIFNSHKKDSKILFTGCAPCQPFSRQNNSKNFKDDPRSNLLKEFSRFVEFYLPDYIFFENVPGIQKLDKKYATPFSDFLSVLDKYNYNYDYGILSALWFGVPQNRKRLILLAAKNEQIKLPEKHYDGEHKKFTTVQDYIGGLPKVDGGIESPNLRDHRAPMLSAVNLERIISTPEGGDRRSWPEALQLECHKRHAGHNDTYGRLSWSKPSSVLTTKCTSYSNGRFGHPDQNRAITVREAALIQTFPLDYKFIGSWSSKTKQIGNAVPPLMAKAIAEQFIKNHI